MRRRVRGFHVLFFLAALVLCVTVAVMVGGCTAATPEPKPSEPFKQYQYDTITPIYIGKVSGNTLYKFCDGPNLVYVSEATRGNSIAVVGNAGECAK